MLASRAHYSMDMVVAVYMSVGVWFSFEYAWLRLITDPDRLFYDLRHRHYFPLLQYDGL